MDIFDTFNILKARKLLEKILKVNNLINKIDLREKQINHIDFFKNI